MVELVGGFVVAADHQAVTAADGRIRAARLPAGRVRDHTTIPITAVTERFDVVLDVVVDVTPTSGGGWRLPTASCRSRSPLGGRP